MENILGYGIVVINAVGNVTILKSKITSTTLKMTHNVKIMNTVALQLTLFVLGVDFL